MVTSLYIVGLCIGGCSKPPNRCLKLQIVANTIPGVANLFSMMSLIIAKSHTTDVQTTMSYNNLYA